MKEVVKFIQAIKNGSITKMEASVFMGISRPTLDKRIDNPSTFTKAEIALIKTRTW